MISAQDIDREGAPEARTTVGGYTQFDALPGACFKQTEGGVLVAQDGEEYLARAWTLRPDFIEVLAKAGEYGFTCLIRRKHPLPANRLPAGVEYVGFSRTPDERWAFVLDQYSCTRRGSRADIARLTFEKHYEKPLRDAGVPFEREQGGGQNLFVKLDQLLFALEACAASAEAVEQALGTRDWEKRKSALGFVTESLLESFLVKNWQAIPELRDFRYLGRQIAAGGGYLDVLAEDTRTGELVVIELKRGRVGPEVVTQLQRYLGSSEVRNIARGRGLRGLAISRAYFPGAHAAATLASVPIHLWTYDGDKDSLRLR